MTNLKYSIRWYNVGYYGEIAGSIIVDGKIVGKVRVASTGTALLVMLPVNPKLHLPTSTWETTTYPVEHSTLQDVNGIWNPKGIRQAGREAVAFAIAQCIPRQER